MDSRMSMNDKGSSHSKIMSMKGKPPGRLLLFINSRTMKGSTRTELMIAGVLRFPGNLDRMFQSLIRMAELYSR